MNMLVKLKLHWFIEGFKTIRIFKNWPAVLRSNFAYRNKRLKALLRNGARFIIRANRLDACVIREVFAAKVYHKNINVLKDNSVVIDIGGNIGAFSVLAARKNNSINVFTYEPFEENFLLLNDNIAANNLKNQIKPFNLAVGKTKGPRTVYWQKSDALSSLYESQGEQIRIDMTTLRDVFEDNGISTCDLLKMDCEGAEYEILYSTPADILARIKTMSIEFHDGFGTGKGTELKSWLKEQGFVVAMQDNTGYNSGIGYIHAHNRRTVSA